MRSQGNAAAARANDTDTGHQEDVFGADRRALLEEFAKYETYRNRRGFAYARPGRFAWHFGPCVAKEPEIAKGLLEEFLSRHGDEPSILDLFDENEPAVELASAAGYRQTRKLTRMLRGDLTQTTLAFHPTIYALAGFEYG